MSVRVLVVPTIVPKVRKELGIEGAGKGRKKNLFLRLLGFPSVDEFFDLYREIWRYVEDWDSLDEERKEKLKRFAYAMLEMEEEGNKVISKYVRNPFDRLKIYLYAIYLFVEFNRNPEKLFDMVTMTQKIVDEILDRVEMDSPRFQRDLKRTLESFDESKITEIDDSDEFMRRMRERYLKKKFG